MGLIPTLSSFSSAGRKLPQKVNITASYRKTQFLHSWNTENLASSNLFTTDFIFAPPTCFVKGTKKTPSLKIRTDIVLPKSTRSYAGSLQTHTNSCIKQSKQQLITTPGGSDQDLGLLKWSQLAWGIITCGRFGFPTVARQRSCKWGKMTHSGFLWQRYHWTCFRAILIFMMIKGKCHSSIFLI